MKAYRELVDLLDSSYARGTGDALAAKACLPPLGMGRFSDYGRMAYIAGHVHGTRQLEQYRDRLRARYGDDTMFPPAPNEARK